MKLNSVVKSDIENIVKGLKTEIKELEGKTILITGGSGFLGKYFLLTFAYLNDEVFKDKCRVISVDNFITGKKDSSGLEQRGDFTFIQHDVRMPLNIKSKINYIIHAAGIASPVYYMKYPLETLEVATLGTKHLLELAKAKSVKSFLFFSSSEIYGDPDPNFIPTPETYPGNVSCTGPRSCYDESKRLGETLCMIYHRLHDLSIKTVRPFNVYGPGMRADDYRVIPRFLTSALKKEVLPVHAGGNQTRTFCYISDAIIGFLKVLLSKKGGEVYNVGNSNDEVNMITLANMVSELFVNKISIKAVEYPSTYPQDDPRRRCPDLTKITKNLGYKSQIDLRDGLKRTLKWYKEELKLKRIKY